jgi:Bacterial SH3 domain
MFSNLLKFILGFTLAIVILAGSGVATALYLMNRVAVLPSKPIFDNDAPDVKAQAPKPEATGGKSSPSPSPQASAEAKPKPTTSPDKAETSEELPPGAYKARVSWSQGLSLRSEPKADSGRAGGVGFNAKIIVLEESPDKTWQKIRLEDSKQEGWVKAGNTKQDDGQNDSQPAQPNDPQ